MKSSISPAAQAVLDAYGHEVGGIAAITSYERCGLAAALRAAADQVVPEYQITPGGSKIWPSEPVLSIRSELLAIAAELEAHQAEPPRRHLFPTPHQIAECGGPCEQGGPEACDCGLYERSSTSSTH